MLDITNHLPQDSEYQTWGKRMHIHTTHPYLLCQRRGIDSQLHQGQGQKGTHKDHPILKKIAGNIETRKFNVLPNQEISVLTRSFILISTYICIYKLRLIYDHVLSYILYFYKTIHVVITAICKSYFSLHFGFQLYQGPLKNNYWLSEGICG